MSTATTPTAEPVATVALTDDDVEVTISLGQVEPGDPIGVILRMLNEAMSSTAGGSALDVSGLLTPREARAVAIHLLVGADLAEQASRAAATPPAA